MAKNPVRSEGAFLRHSRPRPDGPAKVTGKLQYLTDLSFPGMLFGKVLRSPHPHAVIESMDTEHATALPGVHAVLTHQDVPGMNRFGIVIPDQPVFCEDRVRFVGDAICAVAADSVEIAEQALRLIDVRFQPLPVVTDAKEALKPESPRLHPGGNILHRSSHHRGDVEEAMTECSVIVEETYETPRQMHAYLETEGGVVVPDDDGGVTVFMGTQHGYRDRQQLARILAMPEERIRIISSPMGGSFGGKDELNLQPYATLLALATGRPVKMHHTRAESIRCGIKRHPMRIHMKTGVDADGHILAHEVSIVADSGAYATLGPAVLDFAVEHASGPYRIDNVSVQGVSVYTNNGVSGEFRGFGGNQVAFALEGQIDRIAAKLQMDPLALRRLNLRREDDRGPAGQRIAPTNGAGLVLEKVLESKLWAYKGSEGASGPAGYRAAHSETQPWKRYGIGMALGMHGSGLGFGRPDMAGGRLQLSEDGKIIISFGLEEVGQGLVDVIERIATEELCCAPEDLLIRIGDTRVVPASGSTTASRATHVVYHSIKRMKPAWQEAIVREAGRLVSLPPDELRLGPSGVWHRNESHHTMDHPEKDHAPITDRPLVTYRELAQRLKTNLPSFDTHFSFPTTPDAVIGGHYLYTFAAVIAQVEVDMLTGHIQVLNLNQAIAAGSVVSPMGYLGQIEGGGSMALGFTLMEDAPMLEGQYQVGNLDSYLIPTIADVPWNVEVDPIETLPPDDPFGPRGVGEIGTVAVAPAIVAAVHNATGHFVSRLPISAEEIVRLGSR